MDLLYTFQPNTVGGGHAPCIGGCAQDKRPACSWGTSWDDKDCAYASDYINAGFFNEAAELQFEAKVCRLIRKFIDHASKRHSV